MSNSTTSHSARRAVLVGSIATFLALNVSSHAQFVWDGGGAPSPLWSWSAADWSRCA